METLLLNIALVSKTFLDTVLKEKNRCDSKIKIYFKRYEYLSRFLFYIILCFRNLNTFKYCFRIVLKENDLTKLKFNILS